MAHRRLATLRLPRMHRPPARIGCHLHHLGLQKAQPEALQGDAVPLVCDQVVEQFDMSTR